ncbi:MAG TPA: hypothetical protein VGM63_11030 [Mucilaginibacter sp.]|jgi:hypothetical protein
MFNVPKHKVIIKDMHRIVSNMSVLLNDGDNDLLYTGTNPYGNRILGAIVLEDDEDEFVRYIHVIVTDEQYNDFFNKKISLRHILEENESFFIVDKFYDGTESDNFISIDELPDAFKPLKNSFCPDIVEIASLQYVVSLKGQQSDDHIATAESLNQVNSKFSNFFKNATAFTEDFNLEREVYIQALTAGSFQISYQIDLQSKDPANNQAAEVAEIGNFLNNYLEYVFNELPAESNNIFRETEVQSRKFKALEEKFEKLYLNKSKLPLAGVEQKIVDSITYSVNALKDLAFNAGFEKIEIRNTLQSGFQQPVGLIDDHFLSKVEAKLPQIEDPVEKATSIDEKENTYEIIVYSFNTKTGNGGASVINGDIIYDKMSLHVRGLTSYQNSPFTISMNEGKPIKVKGVGKWVNGKIKLLTVTLG